MKKITAYILSILLLLGNMSFAFAYSDITDDYSWARDAITALSQNNTINGYPNGTFLPEQNVTRAELCKMVCMLLGYAEAVEYSDVSETDWFYGYVSRSGSYFTAGDAFHPNRFATREEVAYAVYSALKINQVPTDKKISFSDQENIDTSYLAGVKFLHEQSVLTGYPDGSFRPQNPVTRAETAVILYRSFQLKTAVATPQPTPEEDSSQNTLNYFFLVSKVATVLDENGEIATKITGYQNGKQEELLLPENVNITHGVLSSGGNVKSGDLIAFIRDLFGNIRTVSVGANVSALPQYYGIELLTYANNTKRQVLYGTVEKRYQDKGIELLSTDGTATILCTLLNDTNVYLWKNGKVSLSDVYEINDSTYDTGDKIVAYCYDDEISEIIIIKE